jgi:hypothetical protein
MFSEFQMSRHFNQFIQAAFIYKSYDSSFSVITIEVCIILTKKRHAEKLFLNAGQVSYRFHSPSVYPKNHS